MRDIHTHILPGIDDGAASIEAAAAMLQLAAEDGITDMVATPHWDARYRFDFDRCSRELARVRALCPAGPRLYLGCELHLTPENLEAALREPSRLTLNGNGYLLVELADCLQPPSVNAAMQILVECGLRPIVAHPERNLYIQKNLSYSASLVAAGCYLQLTAQSLAGSFGSAASRAAWELLRRQMAHFVASDAHGVDHRRPVLAKTYGEVARRCGQKAAQRLFIQNPQAAIAGEPIRHLSSLKRPFWGLFCRTAEPPEKLDLFT
ncbi:MAG TPA: CpsB/CapC family capsule biosynthesis tyrosine phosphatase [Bryobacteraceae bacterium]|nr:CpsB/CapC family capsule biosynthesis tyrosine phosphatase [Bryobacteraceae bacterium]